MSAGKTTNSSTGTAKRSLAVFLRLVLAVNVALGACLLFQLEPLAGKIITPRFGGTAGTWSVCLLFFQLIVLAGYGLTWVLSLSKPAAQVAIYGMIAALSIIWSCIPVPTQWVSGGADPGLAVLLLLLKNLAVPAFFLSSVSGTMQVWYRRSNLGDPYPLYALSNVGSLVALLSYPILVEPALSVSSTLHWWTLGYWCLIALVLIVGFPVWKASVTPVDQVTIPDMVPASGPLDHKVSLDQVVGWIFSSTAGALVLMSYTSYITSDIAPVPLLWVLPLSLYLLTFVLVFSGRRFYRPVIFTHAWLYIACLEATIGQMRPMLRLGLSLLLIFLMCMVCHGELAASKPHASKLPVFYFCMSVGGVLAGIFIALIAPVIFDFELERFLALAMVTYLTLVVIYHRKYFLFGSEVASYALVAIPAAGILVLSCVQTQPENLVKRFRNFYSAVSIVKDNEKTKLIHGRILHGEQFLQLDLAKQPGTYYKAPVQLLDEFLKKERRDAPLRVGAVGLGTGTLAAYGRTGDKFTFFELDPKIEQIARTWFSYLRDSRAHVDVQLGDGRATLDRLEPQNFDLIFVDAFNGDAIPLHLLTKEAMVIYLKHLKPDGLLVFHVTNKYINLPRPVAKTGRESGLYPILVQTAKPNFRYLVMARHPSMISKLHGFASENWKKYPDLHIIDVPDNAADRGWTDDFADVLSAFRK